MNTDHIQSIHTTQTALAHTGSTALREGSSVSGRVIQKTGPQSYVVSLAGRQIEVRSEQTLVPGSSFTAKITLRGDTVALVLRKETVPGTSGAADSGEASLVTKFTSSSLLSDGMHGSAQMTDALQAQNTALMQMMSQLGLPSTPEAVHLVQLAQELGVKIKPESIKKALAQSAGFSGSEEEAAATSLLLEEKGLASGEKSVRAVFDGKGNGGGKSSGRENGGGKENNSGKSSCKESGGGPLGSAAPQNNQSDIIDGELIRDYVSSADDAAGANRRGALTVFNMLEPGWIVLPFEWERLKSHGVIRVFHPKFVQKPKKIAVECQTSLKKYVFMLYFMKDKLEKVVYRIMPPVPCEQQKLYSGMLEQMMLSCAEAGSSIPVAYTDSELFSGFCAADVPLSAAKGEA